MSSVQTDDDGDPLRASVAAELACIANATLISDCDSGCGVPSDDHAVLDDYDDDFVRFPPCMPT